MKKLLLVSALTLTLIGSGLSVASADHNPPLCTSTGTCIQP
ncbi:hypothetical protein [Bacillus sp. SM2101]|nr:hypothetical protein [Bacillus sp. SM2101]